MYIDEVLQWLLDFVQNYWIPGLCVYVFLIHLALIGAILKYQYRERYLQRASNPSYKNEMKELEKKDKAVNELQIRILSNERDQLRQQLDSLKSRHDTQLREQKQQSQLLSKDNTQQRKQLTTLRSENEQLHGYNAVLQASLDKTKSEKDNALTRLSKVLGDGLVQNNPNIADLSDLFRPTKLADMFNELYDNQWTSAFSSMNDAGVDEYNCVRLLLLIVMRTHSFCHAELHGSIQKLAGKDKDAVATIKDKMKHMCRNSRVTLCENFSADCNKDLDKHQAGLSSLTDLSGYIQECFKLCWYMALQDPPMVFRYTPGNGSDEEIPQEMRFSREYYREYTKRGAYIHYIVWPIMLLHENGPLLSKGVAEGCTFETSRRN